MNLDLIKDLFKYGGPGAAILVLVLLLGFFVIRDGTDRYTGNEARVDKSAARIAREAIADKVAALELMMKEQRAANNRSSIILTQMQGSIAQMAADVRRTSEDMKTLKLSVASYNERLVKMEAWRDGPSHGDK